MLRLTLILSYMFAVLTSVEGGSYIYNCFYLKRDRGVKAFLPMKEKMIQIGNERQNQKLTMMENIHIDSNKDLTNLKADLLRL